MNNLILVRHGQSFWNKERRFTGWADIDLTEHGKLEAKWAGQLIKELHIEFDAYFTSVQKRAIHTIEIILDILNKKNSEIKKAWELNERHYGALTGLNKDEIMKKHGKKKVHIWRRSFDVSPPPMEKTNPNHPSKNKAYINIPADKIPSCESLKNTFDRVIPYYEKNIKPILSSNKNILISAHGNSLRALFFVLGFNNSKDIAMLEIPTGKPFLVEFKQGKIVNKNYL